VALIKGIVLNHFERQVSCKLMANVSRLVSQWEESINSALLNMEKEAEHRLDELAATVSHLLEAGEGNRLRCSSRTRLRRFAQHRKQLNIR
jgi:hypothetical protein